MKNKSIKLVLIILAVIGVLSGHQILQYVFADTTQTSVACTSFTYSDWSSCQTDGTQTRTVVSSLPNGCTGGSPTLKQSCSLCTNRTYLDQMNQDNCLSSQGSWNTNNCVCTCPTGYHFQGTGCLYTTTTTTTNTTNTSTTTTTVPTCNFFNYSDWSSCQTDGTQTRTVVSSYPSGCTGGGPVLSQTCTYVAPTTITTACDPNRPYVNSMNQDNCTWSGGTWNTTNCVCTCPVNYHFQGTGCLYTPPACSFDYSVWSSCPATGQQTRTVLLTYPTGCTEGTPVLSQSCVYTNTTANPTTSGTTNTTTTTTTTNTINTTNTASTINVASSCTSFTYSDWSSCQTDGTQTRTVVSSLPNGCTGGSPTLKQSCSLCTNRTYLDQMNQDNCLSSQGSWNTNNCVCTCPTGYHFQGTGCLYTTPAAATCNSFVYSNWGTCTSGQQTRTIVSSTPTGCSGGQSEVLVRSCEESATVYCQYTFSDYGPCDNGQQARTVLSRMPTECVEKMTEPLEKACTAEKPKVACAYIYSQWSDCTSGQQTRKIVSAYPEGCISGDTTLEQTCENKQTCTEDTWNCGDWSDCSSAGTQDRTCSLAFDCASVPNRQPETSRSCIYKAPEAVSTQNQETTTGTQNGVVTPNTAVQTTTINNPLPAECVSAGWSNNNDCEIYLQQSRIVSDCLSRNLNNQDQCRTYFLSKYGKPLKCQGISDSECNNLINNVILSDLKTTIAPAVQQALSEVAGRVAVIDTESKTITVSPVSQSATQTAEPQKEIKVENMPLSSASGQVSVSLLPVTTTPQQQTLSPVAIVFDTNGNGIPDDVEKRLGSVAQDVKSITPTTLASLSGVDQALITGKPLEQPKLENAPTSTSLAVNSVETVKTAGNSTTSNLMFQGKAQPGEVVTLFIYSTMPIVVTVKADSNGNWVYNLDKTLVDGTHEVYVAINDNQGRIVEASVPTPFFIAQAQAVSMDNFMQIGSTAATAQPSTKSSNMVIFYVAGGIIFILFLVSAFLIVKERSTH